MLFEINLVAGKMLIMQHQLIEVLKISPRHIVENLAVDYREKISDRWSSGILRSVVPTHDFAQHSEESIGDTHKKIAKAKRTNEATLEGQQNLMQQLTSLTQQMENDTLKVED